MREPYQANHPTGGNPPTYENFRIGSPRSGTFWTRKAELKMRRRVRSFMSTPFYISHANNLFQDQGKPLRFSRHLETWVDDVSLVWGDLFDRQAPFSASLVAPELAFFTMPDTVGILMVVQHHTPLRTACLTTTIEPRLPHANIAQIAHSFDVVIPYRHVLLHGRVSDLCDDRHRQGLGQCTINIGRLELPVGQPIRLHEGLSLTIRIPPPVPEDQWEEQLVARLRSLYPPREPWDWGDGDAVNLMSRRATSIDASRRRTTSSRTSSSSSSSSSSSRSTRMDPWHEALLSFAMDALLRQSSRATLAP